ncbi:MAG: hypothetical protein EB120_10010 [Proteobacteria bacterium]|nr:hypothetical protein [Pseudomonadota bacterium]
MPANKTSFKKGHKRSKESIAKQVATMKKQIKMGERVPPKPNWNSYTKAKMVNSIRKTLLIKNPIGTKRIHESSRGLFYWIVKVSDKGRWKYEHRVKIENKLGRKLRRDEHIHHKNEDSLDNRLSNLMVVSHKEHMEQHAKIRRKQK